jgi:hypothetical protein
MEAIMQKLKFIRAKLGALRSWLKPSIDLARLQEDPSVEPEQEEHLLDAMRSWRDPAEPTGTLNHQHHHLRGRSAVQLTSERRWRRP